MVSTDSKCQKFWYQEIKGEYYLFKSGNFIKTIGVFNNKFICLNNLNKIYLSKKLTLNDIYILFFIAKLPS